MYHRHFERFRHQHEVRVLEIGVGGGGSLLMWRDYFSSLDARVRVIGIDILPQFVRDVAGLRDIVAFVGDAGNRTFVDELARAQVRV